MQGCGSVLDPDAMVFVEPDPVTRKRRKIFA
jgi:hypothetical protein